MAESPLVRALRPATDMAVALALVDAHFDDPVGFHERRKNRECSICSLPPGPVAEPQGSDG